MENLTRAIKTVIETFGQGIIFEPKVVSALSDYGAFKNCPAHKLILREIIKNGYMREYADAPEASRHLIISKIIVNCGFERGKIEEIFSVFFPNEDSILGDINKSPDVHSKKVFSKNSVNWKTEIIFIIDSSLNASCCSEAMQFTFRSIMTGLNGHISVRILSYNDSAMWVRNGGFAKEKIEFPSLTYSGSNSFGNVLSTLQQTNIDWENCKFCPIFIWMVGSNIIEDFKHKLRSLQKTDILFYKAIRYSIGFGLCSSKNELKSFASAPDYVFSSIQIDEIIDSIQANIETELIRNDKIDDLGIRLLRRKISTNVVHTKGSNFARVKSDVSTDVIFACKKDQKWGCINSNNQTIAPFQYDKIQQFDEGLAPVSSTRQLIMPRGGYITYWTYITVRGQEITPQVYNEIKPFKNGYAIVHKERNGWGIIDRNGKEVVPCLFNDITQCHNDLFIVKDDNYRTNKSPIIKYGLYSSRLNIFWDTEFEWISEDSFQEGFPYAIARLNQKLLLLNKKKRILAELPFNYAQKTDFASILLGKENSYGGKSGLCSLDGSIVLECKYDDISLGRECILARIGEHSEMYTTTGEAITEENLLCGRLLQENFYGKDKIGRCVKISANGEISYLSYDEVLYVFENGNMLIKVKKPEPSTDSLYWIANSNGDKILALNDTNLYSLWKIGPQQYERMIYPEDIVYVDFKYNSDNNLMLRKYFHKINGVPIMIRDRYTNSSSTDYEYTNRFPRRLHSYDNYVVFQRCGGSCVIFDLALIGTEHFSRLDDVKSYNPHRIIYKTIIDNEGNNRILPFDDFYPFSDNIACFKSGDLYGFMYRDGTIAAEAVFEKATSFCNGYAAVLAEGIWYIINSKMQIVRELDVDDVKFVQSK